MRTPNRRHIARALAVAALAGPWTLPTLTRRLLASFRPAPSWLVDLAQRLVHDHIAAPDVDTLAARLHDDALVRAALASGEPIAPIAQPVLPPLVVPGLPALADEAALADWLGLDAGELVWLADAWSQEARRPEGPQRHYRYRWLARDYGSDRLIEMPKRRLRDVQRRIHLSLLRHITVHAAAYGFVRGRSAIDHARRHVGAAWVLRLDLSQFFCHVTRVRVRGVFALLGYAPGVAALLAALATNRVPTPVLDAAPHRVRVWEERQRYLEPHLPQGAPTSPALANAVAFVLDVRLAALATTFGATYSRYADDLTFSHPRWSRTQASRCARMASEIAADCGFVVNPRKTLLMGAQHAQTVTGVVVNRHPNLARRDYDRLKAILTNCVRHGPTSQNREGRADFRAWLRGHVAYAQAVNPLRARKLLALYEAIAWV
jgi:hypothetical protein